MTVVQMAPQASLEIENRWDDAHAARLSPAELLLYRSNLLGSDKRITNFGGGNTSAKTQGKGSADRPGGRGALGQGFGRRSRDDEARRLLHSIYGEVSRAREVLSKTGKDSDSTLVPLYAHCAFNLNPRAASIDTPLHGLVNRAHVDHMHPDALIAIAASADSKKLTEEIFGGEIGWLPWIRPGYELGLKLRELTQKNPKLKGAVLEAHGLFTWADTSKACYENTLDIINRATAWLNDEFAAASARSAPSPPRPLTIDRRREIAAGIMPAIRGIDLGQRTRCSTEQPAAQGRPLRRQRNRARLRRRRKTRRPRGTGHFLPRSLPAHEDLAAGAALRSGARHRRTTGRAREARHRGLSRALRRATTTAASVRARRRCATRIPWSIWCPASA